LIEAPALKEELSAALGAPRYERIDDRRGCRNDVEERYGVLFLGGFRLKIRRRIAACRLRCLPLSV
jgi:hypothetical protein